MGANALIANKALEADLGQRSTKR